MSIVDRRLRTLLRGSQGLSVYCEPERLTRVSIVIPDAQGVA
jgi:LytS/YehU family sensor histidine kinase